MNFFINSPITSLGAYEVESPKGKLTKVNAREFYSISYRKAGSVKLNVCGKTFISHPGCITFTPKNTEYTTEVMNDTHIIAIHFDYPCKNEYTEPFVYENDNHIICGLFDEIYKKYSAEDADNYECYSLFYKLLSELKKNFEKILLETVLSERSIPKRTIRPIKSETNISKIPPPKNKVKAPAITEKQTHSSQNG